MPRKNKYPKKLDSESPPDTPSSSATPSTSGQPQQSTSDQSRPQQQRQPQMHQQQQQNAGQKQQSTPQQQQQQQPPQQRQSPRQPRVPAQGPPPSWGIPASNVPCSKVGPSSTDEATAQMKGLSIGQEKHQPQPQQQKQPQQQPQQKQRELTKPSAFYPICPNKGPGTSGRKVIIETNYLALDISKMVKTAYHYDITIEPNTPKRLLQKVFGDFRKINFPRICMAFDGQKNAYAPKVLDLSKPVQREIKIIDPENGQERMYMVSIKEVRGSEINLSSLRNYKNSRQLDIPMRAIQCLDIILKASFQRDDLIGVQCGRSFFTKPTRRFDLGDFYELWSGIFQSTILGSIPYVNVDIAHKAFPMESGIMDLIIGIGSQNRDRRPPDLTRELDQSVIAKLRMHLKGLRIAYKMPGNDASTKVYKFADLDPTAVNCKFSHDGQTVSVQQYFLTKYNYRIRYSNMPCIKVGNALRSFVLPAELCSVVGGQAVQKRCTETQTRNMIREAATNTDKRKEKVMSILRQINYNQSETVRNFGLSVDNKFAEVPARILRPPELRYANGNVTPRDGVWRAESKQFLLPQKAANWGFLKIDYRTQRNALQSLGNLLIRLAGSVKMELSPNFFIEEISDRARDDDITRVLNNIKSRGTEILFCIIPDSGDSYAQVKQAAELRCGVLTQCIKASTVYKKGNDASTVSNILLKVNAKLNGTNHTLLNSPVLDNKCMVIGADVTHPSPDQSRIPSVVGVSASHDAHAFCYNICWRLQDPRTEMIKDFEEIIKEQLRFYQEKNGRLPEKILYFRDGISEGQFQELMATEVQAMRRACQSFQMTNCKITIVVVQKRHHTRFFPGQSGIGDRKNNNVPAGTIVDTHITYPNETHYYMVSHQSIQGVAKPTKYCVLCDESNINIDDLQALTYNLCHMFTRCNRSVSYPAPTYYAHLAAYRGRVYIEGRNDINMNQLEREYVSRRIQPNIVKGHPMYFV